MEELHRVADKVFTEVDHLALILERDDVLDETHVALALAVAKRVRRDATLLVRQLAAHRDQLQP